MENSSLLYLHHDSWKTFLYANTYQQIGDSSKNHPFDKYSTAPQIVAP